MTKAVVVVELNKKQDISKIQEKSRLVSLLGGPLNVNWLSNFAQEYALQRAVQVGLNTINRQACF